MTSEEFDNVRWHKGMLRKFRFNGGVREKTILYANPVLQYVVVDNTHGFTLVDSMNIIKVRSR